MRSVIKSNSLVLVTVFLSACGGSSSNSRNADNSTMETPVKIAFSAVAANQDITCGTTFLNQGSAGTSITFEDLRFYIHNLQLISSKGDSYAVRFTENDWQTKEVALLDFLDKADKCSGDAKPTHTELTGFVSSLSDTISWSGIRFNIGLPESLNHQDQAAAQNPLNILSMHWSWQSGYKFIRVDVAPVGGGVRTADGALFTAWNFHLGSTDCVGSPQTGSQVVCTQSNRPLIELADFDPSQQRIQFNYSNAFQYSNLAQDDGGAAGCMSGLTDPECNAVFSAFGINLATGEASSALTQTAFEVVNF